MTELTTKTKVNVILDTNFLIDMFRFRVSFEDIEDAAGCSCEFYVTKPSVAELEHLKNKKNKYAKVGLNFITKGKVKILERQNSSVKERNADEAIMSFIDSLETGFAKSPEKREATKKTIVATNDEKLRKRIKALREKNLGIRSVRTIYLRAKKRLEIK